MKNHKDTNPPFLIRTIFQWWCKRADVEDLIGDIDEYFQYNLKQKGKRKAQFIYLKQVISLSFSYSLQKRKKSAAYSSYYSQNSIAMFKNYFKIAIRNFAKQRLFTTINLIGLSMGMSVSILILAVLSQVIQFDDFHTNKESIYRVLTTVDTPENDKTYASTFVGIYEEFKENYPGIKNIVRVDQIYNPVVIHNDNEVKLSGNYTDPSYFEVFSFDLERGNELTALQEPYSMVISKEVADKLYPNDEPMGKVVRTKEHGEYKITGILKDHPKQTHLKSKILMSYSTLDNNVNTALSATEKWQDFKALYVYLHFDLGKVPLDFQSALTDLSVKANEFVDDKTISFELQAFTDINPGLSIHNDNAPFDWLSCMGLFLVGLLILIPACLNYMNLMIAKALKRAKEIGIRKIVGSNRRQLVSQFVVEAMVLTSISLIGSMVIFSVIRDEFISLLTEGETLDLSFSPIMISWFVIFGIATGFFAGVFPAIYYSKIKPLESLKGEIKSNSFSITNIRKSLIVIQFSISLGFIIGIGIIVKQHRDILNYNLGFIKEGVLAIPLKGIDQQVLKNEYVSVPGVKQLSLASAMPGVETGLNRTSVFHTNNQEDSIRAYEIFIDENFIQSLNFKMKWGNNIDRIASKAEELFLVNEAFMRKSKAIYNEADSLTFLLDGIQKGQVTGVLKDFNFMQLNTTIRPLIVRYNPEKAKYALLHIDQNNILGTLDELEAKWMSIDQNIEFESFFLDHKIEDSYKSTYIMLKIIGFLGALSIVISCIGLLGMVVYFTENHIKEIAIRKIMGASLADLYVLLGSSFVKLLVIAAIIATPISYFIYDKTLAYLMNKYTLGVGWIEISISVLFMFVLGILPITWMVSKIAKINPAISLRYE